MDYTKEMLATMRKAAPLNLETVKGFIAKDSAFKLASTQSIIAKAKAEGIDYIAKAPAAKRAKGATKAQIVSAIESKTNAKLGGLEKATASSLGKLLDALQSA